LQGIFTFHNPRHHDVEILVEEEQSASRTLDFDEALHSNGSSDEDNADWPNPCHQEPWSSFLSANPTRREESTQSGYSSEIECSDDEEQLSRRFASQESPLQYIGPSTHSCTGSDGLSDDFSDFDNTLDDSYGKASDSLLSLFLEVPANADLTLETWPKDRDFDPSIASGGSSPQSDHGMPVSFHQSNWSADTLSSRKALDSSPIALALVREEDDFLGDRPHNAPSLTFASSSGSPTTSSNECYLESRATSSCFDAAYHSDNSDDLICEDDIARGVIEWHPTSAIFYVDKPAGTSGGCVDPVTPGESGHEVADLTDGPCPAFSYLMGSGKEGSLTECTVSRDGLFPMQYEGATELRTFPNPYDDPSRLTDQPTSSAQPYVYMLDCDNITFDAIDFD